MTSASAYSPPTLAERASWHSPLPYLFGGLAAMLSLIAFALVILACSYWNLSRHDNDLETGSGDAMKIDAAKPPTVNSDEKVLVIMAGNQNPTFLATPVCVRVSSAIETANGESRERKTPENREKPFKDDGEVTTQANTVPPEQHQ